jgi:hypothetical protein
MPKMLDPFRFLLVAVAGWMNQQQQHAIEYLREENRILRAQLGSRRLRLTDDERRSSAAKSPATRKKDAGGNGNDCHAGDIAELAPQPHRRQI